MNRLKSLIFGAVSLSLGASYLLADTVTTTNGSTLNGTIVNIDSGKITLQTDFAGEITLDQSQVVSFSTENPIYMAFDSGNTYLGTVDGSESGDLSISTSDGTLSTSMTKLSESWQPGAQSPSEARQEAEIEKLQRKWSHQASFDLTGKSGNSDSTGFGASFRSKLKGPDDVLQFYVSANYVETDDNVSSDDAKGGVDYANTFSDKWSWYVRTEVGRDAVADIELRSLTAAGFGYSAFKSDTRLLTFRGGLSYLYESYGSNTSDSSAGVDLSLHHEETFSFGKLVNDLSYTPSIDDFGDYQVFQDSAFEMPLKNPDWKLRIGISNEYDSDPQPGIEELDTLYYTRLILNFN